MTKPRKRCKCVNTELVKLPELPGVLICASCGGWFSARIHSVEDLDKFNAHFSMDAAAGEGMK